MDDVRNSRGLGARGSNHIQHQRIVGVEGARSFPRLRMPPGVRPEEFVFTQDSVRLGNYLFSRVSATPSIIDRNDVDAEGELRFTFLLHGRMNISQAGRTVQLRPGDSAITIGWQPFRSEIIDPSVLVRVAISRDVLDSRGIVFPHTVRKLAAPSVLASGIAGFFLALFDPALYPLRVEQVARLLRVFDAFFVELHLGYVEELKTPEGRLQEQREAVLEFVRARSAVEDLTVARVAEHYSMSTRSLQRLFQGSARSLRDELRLIQAGS